MDIFFQVDVDDDDNSKSQTIKIFRQCNLSIIFVKSVYSINNGAWTMHLHVRNTPFPYSFRTRQSRSMGDASSRYISGCISSIF